MSMMQVDELRAQNSELESRTAQLAEANEKLADSEGRLYSLARELENQMEVIKKVMTLHCTHRWGRWGSKLERSRVLSMFISLDVRRL